MSYCHTTPALLLILTTFLCCQHASSLAAQEREETEIERSESSRNELKPKVRKYRGLAAFRQGFRYYSLVHPLGDYTPANAAEWQELDVEPEIVVSKMSEAQKYWPEDGERVRMAGYLTVRYLPRFYLGVVFHEVGCFREAVEQFERSILAHQDVRGAEDETETLQRLKRDAEFYTELGVQEEDCSDWPRPQLETDAEILEGGAK